MDNNLIITIGREYGAGGLEVGRRLSEKLSIPFFDKELLTKAAKTSGIAEEFFHSYDEKVISGMYYFGANEYDSITLPRSHQLFEAQSKVMRKIATEKSCIFIGRCADYVLRDFPNCKNFFLHGSKEARAKRMTDVYTIPQSEVYTIMNKIDKQRSRYYNYMTDKKWNAVNSYHLSIDTGQIGIDKTVKLILNYIEL
jgi:cytidylate kinase